MTASPKMYDLIVNNESFENKTHTLKLALVYGDYCTEDLRLKFKDKFELHLNEGYGIAETAGVISLTQMENDSKMKSVGRPIDNVEVKIINEHKDEIKNGEIGEILVSGNNIMKGYWNQPEKTANILNSGWLYTGDLGKIDDDGSLYFIEKKDDVIVKGGFYIFPKEIEDILLNHPKIEQVAIIGVPDPNHKQEVKACVILKEGEKATNEEIIEFCREHVPVYKCPQIVQFYKSFPKSSTGKILKRKLRESFL
jgi:long-chain acyl-CoA synthetase